MGRNDSAHPSDEVRDAGRDDERRDDEHLRDVAAGAGCVALWEHLSEQRED